MTYSKWKYLVKQTELDKVLRDKVFEIASDLKYDGFQRVASMLYKFFDKNLLEVVLLPCQIIYFQILHRQIIRTFKRRKTYSSFRDNIWGVDLADMQSLSKKNRGIRYLFCVID